MQTNRRFADTWFDVQRTQPRTRAVPSVLLVDDCPFQRLLGLALLSRWRITPELARDGQEAIRMAAASRFDMILMDLEMPVLDGLAASLAIRQQERLARQRKRVPVVAYTANGPAASTGLWLRYGIDAVLAKPSTVPDMGACLKRWCPQRLVVEDGCASA